MLVCDTAVSYNSPLRVITSLTWWIKGYEVREYHIETEYLDGYKLPLSKT